MVLKVLKGLGKAYLKKNKKSIVSTDTIKIKPSGKKTETEAYLKNRKKPTTYKGSKFDNKMRDMMNELESKMRRIEKTPEMKAYRKKENWPKK